MTVGLYEAALISCSTKKSCCLFTSAVTSPSRWERFFPPAADVLLILLLPMGEMSAGREDWLTGWAQGAGGSGRGKGADGGCTV